MNNRRQGSQIEKKESNNRRDAKWKEEVNKKEGDSLKAEGKEGKRYGTE